MSVALSRIVTITYSSQETGRLSNSYPDRLLSNSIKDPIKINETLLEYVDTYTYLGKQTSFKGSRNLDEIDRRIAITWNKFWAHKEVPKADLPIHLKKKVMDACIPILPCLTYASQTWTFNKKIRSKILTCQRAMERKILNVKLKDKIKNTVIRGTTKLIDALQHSQKLKWKWAGHAARSKGSKWTKRTTTWAGPKGTRKQGRPQERWADEILKTAGKGWVKMAQDRQEWQKMEEAFTRRGVLN